MTLALIIDTSFPEGLLGVTFLYLVTSAEFAKFEALVTIANV